MDFHLPGVAAETIRAIGVKMQLRGRRVLPDSKYSLHSSRRRFRARLAPAEPRSIGTVSSRTVKPCIFRQMADLFQVTNSPKPRLCRRGGSVLGYASAGEDEEGSATAGGGRGKSLWATLFGGDEDEDAAEIVSPQPRSRSASRGTQTASYNTQAVGSSSSAASFFVAEAARAAEREESYTSPAPSVRSNTVDRNAPLNPNNGPFETNLLPTSAPVPPQRTFAFAALDIPPEQLNDEQGFGNGSRASVVPSVFSGPHRRQGRNWKRTHCRQHPPTHRSFHPRQRPCRRSDRLISPWLQYRIPSQRR